MFARIENGQVVEIWDVPELPPLHPTLADKYVPCDASVKVGMVWDGSTFSEPSVSLSEAKDAKRAELRAAAQSAIIGGVQSSVLGSVHTYPTSETDQQNLTGLILRAQLDNMGGFFWCADGNGVWARRLHTTEQLIQLGREVASHVEAQQAKYESLLQQVEAATTVADVEAVIW